MLGTLILLMTEREACLTHLSAGQGKGCRVMCTQPRRISAITIAERVAAERGEAVGDNVGYSVRLESRQSSPSTSLCAFVCPLP